MDIRGNLWTPVIAFDAGTVVASGLNPHGYGYEVIVEHQAPDGSVYWTQYAHLQRELTVGIGTVVPRGGVLGFVGTTGWDGIGQSHLHFEYRTTKARPGRGTQGRADPAPMLCGLQ